MRQHNFHALLDRMKTREINRYGDCLKDTGTLNRVLMESTGGGLGVHTHCLISESRNVATAQLASGSDRVQKFLLTKLQISKNRTLNSR